MAPSFSKLEGPRNLRSAPVAVRRSMRKKKEPEHFFLQLEDDGCIYGVHEDPRGLDQPGLILDNRDEEEKMLKEYEHNELHFLRPRLKKEGFRIKKKILDDVDHIIVGPHYSTGKHEDAKDSQIHGVTWYKVGHEAWEQYLKDGKDIDGFIRRDMNWNQYSRDGTMAAASAAGRNTATAVASSADCAMDVDGALASATNGTSYDSDATLSVESPNNKSAGNLKPGSDVNMNGVNASSGKANPSTTANLVVDVTPSDESENEGANLITPRSDDLMEDNVSGKTDTTSPTAENKAADGRASSVKNGVEATARSVAAATASNATATVTTNNVQVSASQKGGNSAVRQNGLGDRLEHVETEVFGEARTGSGSISVRLKALEDEAGLSSLEQPPIGGGLRFIFHRRMERIERIWLG